MISLPDDVKFDRRLMKELQEMKAETTESGSAADREAHIERLVAARKQTSSTVKLDVENAKKHEQDVDQVMHSVASAALTAPDRLPKLVRRRFPKHRSRVDVLSKGGVYNSAHDGDSKVHAAGRRKVDVKKKKAGILSQTV